MSWERFGFYCRELSRTKGNENLKEKLTQIEKDSLAQEYGAPIKIGSLQQELLNKVFTTDKPQDNQSINGLNIYGEIDYNILQDKPNLTKRIGIYLAYHYCPINIHSNTI